VGWCCGRAARLARATWCGECEELSGARIRDGRPLTHTCDSAGDARAQRARAAGHVPFSGTNVLRLPSSEI